MPKKSIKVSTSKTAKFSTSNTNASSKPFWVVMGVMVMAFLLWAGYMFGKESQIATNEVSYSKYTHVKVTPTPLTSAETMPLGTPSPNDDAPYLDGYTLRVPKGWTKQIHYFGSEESNPVKSEYFSECTGFNCQSMRLTKAMTHVDLVFDDVMDQHGIGCSNSADVQKLGNGWYKITDSKEIWFAKNNVKLDYQVGEVFGTPAAPSEWHAEGNTKYKVCVQYTGEALQAKMPNSSESVVILEYPRMAKDSDPSLVKEIETMLVNSGPYKQF